MQARARKLGIKVLGFVPWDAKATSYEAIGEQIAVVGRATPSTSAASSATTA